MMMLQIQFVCYAISLKIMRSDKVENTQLYHGDCLEVMKSIPDKSVDMILCDLPYGTTKAKWDIIIPFDKLWEQYERIIKDDGAIVLFGTEPFSSYLRTSNIKLYKYDWVWDKISSVGHLVAKYRPMQQTETISVFYKKRCLYNPPKQKLSKEEYEEKIKKLPKKTRKMDNDLIGKHSSLSSDERDLEKYKYKETTNLIKYSCRSKECNNTNRLHPTQKPVDLLEYLIKTYTNEGETVLDNCMGSGSTGIACLNINRKFIGIELDEKYFEIAKNRIENHEVIK